MRRVLLPFLIVGIVGIAGCGGSADVADPEATATAVESAVESAAGRSEGAVGPVGLDGTSWVLAAGEEPRPTLTITGTSIGGSDACNNYGGELLGTDGEVTGVGPINATRRACEGHAHADFLTRLGGVTGAAIEDGDLVLTSPSGDLRFTSA